jgi:hypothetical protein
VRLTTGADSFSRPAFVPTEKRSTPGSKSEANKTLQPGSTGEVLLAERGPTRNHHREVRSLRRQFRLHARQQAIYLTAEEAGNEKLFTMPADGGEVTLAMDMTRGVYTNLKIPAKARPRCHLPTGKAQSILPKCFGST